MASSQQGITFDGLWAKLLASSFHVMLFVTAAGLTTANQLLAPLSRNSEGKYEYSTQAAVFFAELLKLIMACSMLAYESVVRHTRAGPPPAGELPLFAADPLNHIARYLVTSVLYFVNNNLTFYVLQGIAPSTNMAIGQSKIIFTVALLYVFLGRRFNLQQLLSLAILAAALVVMAVDDSGSGSHSRGSSRTSGSDGAEQTHQSPYTLSAAVGVLLSITIAFNGSLAGVYNEKLLKELPSCMHYQNVIAYTYGVLFNLGFVFIDSSSRAMVRSGGLLVGFNTCSWLYVVVTAMMGLSTSFIYKFQDNIARILAVATSIALTLFLSVPALGRQIDFIEVVMVVIIACALLAYFFGAEHQKELDKQRAKLAPKEGTGLLAT